jgi:hypothetical protein
MKANTARNGRPPQDGAETCPLRRAAGLILLFNGLLAAWVLLKPASDRMLAAVVNSAEFVGPLLALPLCFGGLLRQRRWRRGVSQTDVGPAETSGRRWAPVLLGLGIIGWVLGQAIFTYYEWVLRQPPPLPSGTVARRYEEGWQVYKPPFFLERRSRGSASSLSGWRRGEGGGVHGQRLLREALNCHRRSETTYSVGHDSAPC